MVAVVLIFGFFGIALGTGWAAQLLVGKGRPVDWTQAFWVGVAGMGVAAVVAYLVDRDTGSTFGFVGVLVALAAAAVIQAVLTSRAIGEERAERHHDRELTPEGLPGHHQPKKRSSKKRR